MDPTHSLMKRQQLTWLGLCLWMILFQATRDAGAARQPILTLPEVKVDMATGALIGESGLTLERVAGLLNLWTETGTAQVSCLPGERLLFQILLPAAVEGRPVLQVREPLQARLFVVGVARDPTRAAVAVADVVLPLFKSESEKGTNGLPFSNQKLFPRPAAWQAYLLEIDTANLTPGTYPLQLSLSGQPEGARLVLNVHCLNTSPPAQVDFWLDLNEYGDKYLKFLKRPYRALTLEDRLPWDRVAYRIAHRHHAVLNLLPYRSQAGAPRAYFVPTMVNRDSLNPRLNWHDFDRRFGPYLEGTAFQDGQPVHHFYLPFNPDWPAPFRLYHENRPRYEAIWQAFARAFVSHFREKGWTKTIFQVYCNQKPGPGNAIPWHLDEPKGVKDYRALRYFAELTHRAFAGSEPVQVRFRVDISHFYCDEHRGSKKKDFRVNGGDAILFPVVDIWVVSDHSLYDSEAARQAARLRYQGREVWVYGDTPPLLEAGRLSTWKIFHAWLQGWNGFMAWKSFAHNTEQSKGTNFLLYDLNESSVEGIFPSLRLKLLWRALEDIRVVYALVPSPEQARVFVERLARASMEGDWQTLWQFRVHHRLPE